MPSACIVFGSESDAFVIEKIALVLKEKGIPFEARVCSAHRTPKNLEKLVEGSPAEVFIAGAGLSAALPGVIASQTVRPVIGVPVSGNYSGLDSVLATHQLPPGIPVLGTGIDAGEEAARNAFHILSKPEKIAIVNHAKTAEAEKHIRSCMETLEKFGAEHEINKKISGEKTVFIHFTKYCKQQKKDDALVINVPISENSAKENPFALSQISGGLWVGLGRGENAALAAIEILNLSNNAFEKKLIDFRKQLQEKVLSADESVRKKFRGQKND